MTKRGSHIVFRTRLRQGFCDLIRWHPRGERVSGDAFRPELGKSIFGGVAERATNADLVAPDWNLDFHVFEGRLSHLCQNVWRRDQVGTSPPKGPLLPPLVNIFSPNLMFSTFQIKPCIRLFLHMQLPTLPPAPGRYDSTCGTFSSEVSSKRKPADGATQAQRGCCPKLLTRQSPALWDKGLRSFAETRECRRLLSSGRGKRKTCGLFWHADKRGERGELV